MSQLVCSTSGETYPLDDHRWKSDHGSPLDLHFEASFNKNALRDRKPTLWRYREALPIPQSDPGVTMDEGFTPLMETHIFGKSIWLKHDHLFPTGSYKDRGATLLISRAKALGVERIVEDSSGNAGAAIAAYATLAGIACDIYVPASTSPGKLAQIESYGANLHKIPGSREDTANAVLEAAEHHFYASHVWNPYFFQGTKTFAFEVWEQLDFKAPDTVFIPTGNGTLLIGAYLGFQDLLQQGQIDQMPRLIAVQAANCAPLDEMWRLDLSALPEVETSETLAEGIAIAAPARASQIIDVIRKSHGSVVTVTEEETEAALLKCGRRGLFIEPTSATALAAFSNYEMREGEVVVAPLTGHGLKATEKILKMVSK